VYNLREPQAAEPRGLDRATDGIRGGQRVPKL